MGSLLSVFAITECKKLKVVVNDELDRSIAPVEDVRRRRRKRAPAREAKKGLTKVPCEKVGGDPIHCPPGQSDLCDLEEESVKVVDSQVCSEEALPCSNVYQLLLEQHHSVAPVNDDYTAFMIQDFDQRYRQLKEKYLIVKRRAVSSDDGYVWLYYCGCNPARERIVTALHKQVQGSVAEQLTDLEVSPCIHIKAIEGILEGTELSGSSSAKESFKHGEFDTCSASDHMYGKKACQVDIFGIESSSQVVCVRVADCGHVEYAVVVIDFSGRLPQLRCCLCKKTDCKHAKAILSGDTNTDVSRSITAALNKKVEWRSRYIPVSVSSSKISFSIDPALQKRNRKHFSDIEQVNNVLLLKPDCSGYCSCGAAWSDDTEEVTECYLFTTHDTIASKVFERKCSEESCGLTKDYDGMEDQILNMGCYLVSHDVLRDYMRQFLTDGTTMASFYKQWVWKQGDNGNKTFPEKMSCYRFRYSWYCFLELLDIKYIEGFVCPDCGDSPDTVVMDGIALGLRKTHMPWKSPAHPDAAKYADLDGSFNTRLFIPGKQCRQELLRYTTGTLTLAQFRHLQMEIAKYAPSLTELLNHCYSEGHYSSCPSVFKTLLKCVSSSSPVCAFVHYNERVFDILLSESNSGNYRGNVPDTVLLEEQVPVIAQLLRHYVETPDFLKPVLLAIVTIARQPFENKIPHNLGVCTEECSCSSSHLGYFPSLPKRNHRGQYILDDLRRKTKEGQCSKSSGTHPTLIPGVFTLSCCHGVCYGFHIMEDVESPNIPFTILRTRFHTAPKVVIYDNACNLQHYCLNRDPAFFRDTWFLIDRFHWPNHTGCHEGYNLAWFPRLQNLNTQVAEQRNSSLRRLKSMLSYMNFENFFNHCRLFIWFRSMITLASKHPTLHISDREVFHDLSSVYSNM